MRSNKIGIAYFFLSGLILVLYYLLWKNYGIGRDPLVLTLAAVAFAWSAWTILKKLAVPARLTGKKWMAIGVQMFPELLLAICTTLFVRLTYPDILFDDAGFILRYLKHFEEGYFFTFNPADGPVFGISGFVHGVFTGFLCFAKLASPEQALAISNITGLFLLAWMLARLMDSWFKDPASAFLAWLFCLFGAKMVLGMMNSGMETALHAGILLAALDQFSKFRNKGMWLLLALAVISKLDAAPVAVVVCLMYLWERRKFLLPFRFSNPVWKNPILFGALPLLIWVLFAWVVFGSPLPQTAWSKLTLLGHGSGHWFPFLQPYLDDPYKSVLFFAFILLFPLHLLVLVQRPLLGKTQSLLFGFSFLATLILYYIYNPSERMPWYYSLPDLFLFGQIAVSMETLARLLPDLSRRLFQTLIFAFAILFFFPDAFGGWQWNKRYLSIVEKERIRIGRQIAEDTTEADTIAVWNGHYGAWTDAYVLDMTGLNSRKTAALNLDLGEVIKAYKPRMIINHGHPQFLEEVQEFPYRLAHSYYDIETYGHPVWRWYERYKPDPYRFHLLPVRSAFILTDTLESPATGAEPKDRILRLSPEFPGNEFSRLLFGIHRKAKPFNIRISALSGETLTHSGWIRIDPITIQSAIPTAITAEVSYHFQNTGKGLKEIRIQTDSGEPPILIDPMWEVRYLPAQSLQP